MVYTGKPSRACATCKQRRIKCDEGRPSCGQCTKSKRVCTGWKTEAELMFRDETQITAQRAVRKQIKAHPQSLSQSPIASDDFWEELHEDGSDPDDTIFASPWRKPIRPLLDGNYDPDFNQVSRTSSSAWYLDRTPSPNPALTLNVQERANAYFFNQWAVFGTQHAFHLYDIQQELYRKTEVDSPIRATTEALALLTLSRKPGELRAGQEATRAYAAAVKQVAASIADPNRVKEDQTLLSVILLGFLETIDVTSIGAHRGWLPRYTASPQERNAVKFHHAWGAHAGGAERIVRARGLAGMSESMNSMKLAGFVRMQTLHKQIFIAQPIEDLEEIWGPLAEFRKQVLPSVPANELVDIGIKIPLLRFRGLEVCRKPMARGVGAELRQILADVRAVDEELVAWKAMLAARGQWGIAGYYVEPVGSDLYSQRVWPGAVLNFDSLAVASITNLCRSWRLFLQMLVFNILERLIESSVLQTHPEFTACIATIRATVDEICGAVPYALGVLQHIPLSPVPRLSALGTFITPNLIPSFVRRVEDVHEDGDSMPSTIPSLASTPMSSATSSAGVDAGLDDDSESGPAIGAWYLTWPLYIAYSCGPIPADQKNWIRGRLRYVGTKNGIAQALMYQAGDREVYEPGKVRRFMPLDYAPPPWEPLQ